MFKRIIIVISVIVSMLIYYNAEAATVLWYDPGEGPSGYAYRIKGLIVSGESYNVDFRNESYNTLWPGGGFDMPAEADAIAAVNAINDALNTEQALLSVKQYLIVWDINYPKPQTITYYIPYMGSGTVDTQEGKAISGTWSLGSQQVYDPESTYIYAKLEAVPIPGALWLLGSGLIGLVGVRRKYNK